MSLIDLSKINLDEKAERAFELLPAGEYNLVCVEAIVKDTKDGAGQYIASKFEVINNPLYEGRFVWHNFNIKNKNEQAVNIGLQQLKTFLLSGGRSGNALVSPTQMIGLKTEAWIKIKENPPFDTANRISSFKLKDADKKASNQKTESPDITF